jgi:LuxR family maltose regulon positive regulatory protein
MDRLSKSVDARVTLVSGPAGFGKTTLVAGWLAAPTEVERAVAWLSLDATDDEPVAFWRLVVEALDTALPDHHVESRELVNIDFASTERVLVSLLNELAATPTGIWLVLDDFHMIASKAVHDSLSLLLDRLPANVHVVLSTRADPDLPLSRWRARGELLEIRGADLRFTAEETHAFLNDVSGLNLSPDDVGLLEQRTEGWIAALQLAALSLRERDDPSGFISRFAGNDRHIVDYLVEEVLARQTPEVRTFLLQSAVLDRLSASLCDAVTGRHDAREVLSALERANLFLFPLDDQREWYRYHHLFADLLRSRLAQGSGDEAAELHRRASRWHELHGGIEDSVRHALAAADYSRAAYLIELALPTLRQLRHDALLLGWLAALPDDAVRASPVLSVFYGWLLMMSGDLDAVEARLAVAEDALATASDAVRATWADTDELRTLPATIAVFRASLAQAQGRVAATARHAQQALDLAGPQDHLARGAATAFLGLASWAEGDVRTAIRTFSEAVASLHAAGNLADALNSTLVLADMWVAAGQPSQARRLYAESLSLAEAKGMSLAETTALLHVGLSAIDREAGDLAAARRHLETAVALDDHTSITPGQYRWMLAMGRVEEAEGDSAAAVDLISQAQAVYRQGSTWTSNPSLR